ncbi:MAG: hypothetical protein V3U76_13905 [Granulosicoccus sp.]
MLALFCLVMPSVSEAGIFTCPAANGGKVFQDRPCEKQIRSIENLVRRTSRLPAGMHESWFTKPEQATAQAYCDKQGCECGDITRTFEGGLAQAVSDALYVDGNWLRYEASVVKWQSVRPNTAKAWVLQRDMDEAACEVQMSQRTLREYSGKVMTSVKRKTRRAKELGYINETFCNGSSPQACSYFEAIELYQRLSTDIKALRTGRDGQVTVN